MNYPVQLSSQLQQLLKSLRKARQLTQADLAQRLGVVQSRVADIERDPGAVSVEQLLQVLAMLGAQMVVQETSATPSTPPATSARSNTGPKPTQSAARRPPSTPPHAPSESPQDDEPRGQW